MSPLVLIPCSFSKTLPAHLEVCGRTIKPLSAEIQASTWISNMAAATPKVPVQSLYKGGAWTISKECALLAQKVGGQAYVVSAGLGLATLTQSAPGYDITFTKEAEDSVPGDGSSQARIRWWTQIGGTQSLLGVISKYDAMVIALPELYLDVIAPIIPTAIALLGRHRVTVLACNVSKDARPFIKDVLVKVTSEQTTTLKGNAGQAPLVALLHVLQKCGSNLERTAIQEILAQVKPREAPLYPKRQKMGKEHVEKWLLKTLSSPDHPRSASEALRLYRQAGFAFEQKAFHREFDRIKANSLFIFMR